jgi:hypothetical protein
MKLCREAEQENCFFLQPADCRLQPKGREKAEAKKGRMLQSKFLWIYKKIK